ncbi:MAG: phosphatase PAP2 family protein [Bacteroidota bacterium]
MNPHHATPGITRKMIVMAALALLLLLIIVVLVFILKHDGFDNAVFSLTADHISPACTRFMRAITFLGKHSFLVPANLLLIACFIILKNKYWAISVAVVSLSSLGLMSLLKNMVQRHRPENPMVEGITNFGFPSGHAFMSVAFYGLLALWTAVTIKNKWQRRVIISFLLLLILLIGYSRIYLRVHYATDVIAGFCIGICWLFFCLWLINKIKTGSRLVAKQ